MFYLHKYVCNTTTMTFTKLVLKVVLLALMTKVCITFSFNQSVKPDKYL